MSATVPTFNLELAKLLHSLGSSKQDLLYSAKVLHAFAECSDEIQAGILEVLEVLIDPETDPDDRQLAIATLADALFPNPHEGLLGLDLCESEQMGASVSEETRQALDEMDQEEAIFADRLSSLMKSRGISQVKLAEMSGVGQPAISNMLKRQCRPQRRTVQRFADALGVPPEALWPGFSAQ